MATDANPSTGGPRESAVLERVRRLIDPIIGDLHLDLYDLEQRGGVLRVTIDTPAGSEAGVDLDTLALATRLVSRELDHADPIPGRYTLEVTSPGLERALRTPAHFQREVGKDITVRLRATESEDRRVAGRLVAADAETATVRVTDPSTGDETDREIPYDRIDRARTVFEWGPSPKPGGPRAGGPKRSGGQKHKEKHSS